MANVVIIILVAILGIVIVFLSLNLFTKHGEWDTVPEVENVSYTEAINMLHSHGFRTDIRDSLYNDEYRPGYVIEQFPKPGAKVKPGRKIFLYINAVHPREVIIDGDNSDGYAMQGYSQRQTVAKLEELGFKNYRVVSLPGYNDRVIRLLANGHVIKKLERVPVNALITIEVENGGYRLQEDSLLEEQYKEYLTEMEAEGENYHDYEDSPVEMDYSGDDTPIYEE